MTKYGTGTENSKIFKINGHSSFILGQKVGCVTFCIPGNRINNISILHNPRSFINTTIITISTTIISGYSVKPLKRFLFVLLS